MNEMTIESVHFINNAFSLFLTKNKIIYKQKFVVCDSPELKIKNMKYLIEKIPKNKLC